MRDYDGDGHDQSNDGSRGCGTLSTTIAEKYTDTDSRRIIKTPHRPLMAAVLFARLAEGLLYRYTYGSGVVI
jgi:hypothetical protein